MSANRVFGSNWVLRAAKSAACLLCSMSLVATCGGGSGTTMSLPFTGTGIKATSGLRLDISSYWVEGTGYRPVTFEVTCLPKAKADRRLSIEFSPSGQRRDRSQQVQFSLEIPEGATRVSKTVSVPQNGVWNRWRVEVFEDGMKLKDLSGSTNVPRFTSSWQWTEAYPTMLFIDSDAPAPTRQIAMLGQVSTPGSAGQPHRLPNIQRFTHLFAPEANNSVIYQRNRAMTTGGAVPTDDNIITMVQNLTSVALLPPASLPKQWIDYTCLDLIIVSLDDLQLTAAQQPQAWLALRKFISAGGNLIVYGTGDEFTRLGELETLLAVSVSEPTLGQYPGWELPSDSRYGSSASDSLEASSYAQSYTMNGIVVSERLLPSPTDELAPEPSEPAPDPIFLVRPYDLGRVAAIDTAEPFDQTNQWDWVLAELGRDRWQWYRRNGVSRVRPNQDFWEFLIPGVGAAPVKMFLVIITAFVIVIGPVNYWLLRSWKRLYLLLITVPVGAGIVTACLLAYALVSDGLSVRSRLRSFTELNASSGAAVSWSRQSYYAGIAPSEGLVFPRSAAIFPLDAVPQKEDGRNRNVIWNQDQVLASGFLGARSISQFMVINAAPTEIKLEVDDSQGIQATNRLQVDVEQLVVCKDGVIYWGEDMGVDDTLQLTEIPVAEAIQRLRRVRDAARPAIPTGMTPRLGQYRYTYNSADRSFPGPSPTTSILEASLVQLVKLPPAQSRVYFVVTRRAPPTVPLGVRKARQESGYHVLRGSW